MQRTALLAAAATVVLSLTACGGGGGGGGVSMIPPPPVTPTPPPPPAGAAPVQIFPGIVGSTNFAVLGVELTDNPAAPLTNDGFSVRYDAASNLYIFDLPTHSPGGFHASTGTVNSTFWDGGLVQASQPGTLWPPMTVLKPSAANPEIQLSYTSFAAYLTAGPMEDLPDGFIAFGSATPTGSVPVTGSATYTAYVTGSSLDYGHAVGGSATMLFDFSKGSLAGHFDPVVASYYGPDLPPARYDFVNTIHGVGSTSFSGGLQLPSAPQLGSFDGLFTGPNAQELMARWTAPFFDPVAQKWSGMFGVWVGKRP